MTYQQLNYLGLLSDFGLVLTISMVRVTVGLLGSETRIRTALEPATLKTK